MASGAARRDVDSVQLEQNRLWVVRIDAHWQRQPGLELPRRAGIEQHLGAGLVGVSPLERDLQHDLVLRHVVDLLSELLVQLLLEQMQLLHQPLPVVCLTLSLSLIVLHVHELRVVHRSQSFLHVFS